MNGQTIHRTALAFGIAYLKEILATGAGTADEDKEATHIFGRYFARMKQAGLPANWNITKHFAGYKLQTGAASKLQQGLMPQDILGLEEKRYRGIDDLMQAVRGNNLQINLMCLLALKKCCTRTAPTISPNKATLEQL